MLLLTTYPKLCQALWHNDEPKSVKRTLYLLLSRKQVGCRVYIKVQVHLHHHVQSTVTASIPSN